MRAIVLGDDLCVADENARWNMLDAILGARLLTFVKEKLAMRSANMIVKYLLLTGINMCYL